MQPIRSGNTSLYTKTRSELKNGNSNNKTTDTALQAFAKPINELKFGVGFSAELLNQANTTGIYQYYAGCSYWNQYAKNQKNPDVIDLDNLSKAVEAFKAALDQKHAGAQYHLGLCYLNGEGVQK